MRREKDKNLVTVIVPIYNVEEYLLKCITSIQNQTYKNLQIILVDDGSTDKSGKICDTLAQEDERIQVIHQENAGLVRARKRGLEIARGEYIGFVDGDDYIDENMYSELLKIIMENKADFVHTGYWIDGYRKSCRNEIVCNMKEKQVENVCKYVIDMKSSNLITASIWSKIFKAELIKKCYSQVPDFQSFGEDMICLCACILESNKMVLAPKAFYHYTVRNDSLSNNKDVKNLINEYGLYNALCNLLKEYDIYIDIEDIMNSFLKHNIWNCMSQISKYDFQIMKFYYPDAEGLQGKKVVIYGAGAVGRDYYAQMSRYPNVDIVAWVDAYKEKDCYEFIQLTAIDKLWKLNFDVLVLAMKDQKEACRIKKDLVEQFIDERKIIWKKPVDLLM